MNDSILTIGLVVLLGVMIFVMFRNGRKRQREAAELQNKVVPGAEIMTSHGIFGEIISIDEDKNEAIIETQPGTRLRVHRQTISKVIEPDEAPLDEVGEIEHERIDEPVGDTAEPEFGERAADADAADDTAPKGKKTAE